MAALFLNGVPDLTVGTPAKLSLAGNSNVSDFASEYLYPVSTTGGAQDGYRLWKRRNAGVDITDHNWQQHAFIQKAISTASTSAVTLFTIPVPNGSGLKLSGARGRNASWEHLIFQQPRLQRNERKRDTGRSRKRRK